MLLGTARGPAYRGCKQARCHHHPQEALAPAPEQQPQSISRSAPLDHVLALPSLTARTNAPVPRRPAAAAPTAAATARPAAALQAWPHLRKVVQYVPVPCQRVAARVCCAAAREEVQAMSRSATSPARRHALQHACPAGALCACRAQAHVEHVPSTCSPAAIFWRGAHLSALRMPSLTSLSRASSRSISPLLVCSACTHISVMHE